MEIRYFEQINRMFQRQPDPAWQELQTELPADRIPLRSALPVGSSHLSSPSGRVSESHPAPSFDAILQQAQQELIAPSRQQIAQGATLKAGQSGPAVAEIRQLLRQLDYPVPAGDYFDRDLAHQIGRFQRERHLATPHSPHWGQVGPSTLQALEAEVKKADYHSDLGQQLVDFARRHTSGTRWRCYRFVARAIHANTEPFLQGMHAYMAADQLARSKYFKEVQVPASDLPSLPAGAVVVWGKGRSRSGHISIADGKGNEISDHIAPQMQAHYGGASHRTFIPVQPGNV